MAFDIDEAHDEAHEETLRVLRTTFKIYKLIDPIDEKSRYIGLTVLTLEDRLAWHIKDGLEQCPKDQDYTYFTQSWDDYGYDFYGNKTFHRKGDRVKFEFGGKPAWIRRLHGRGLSPRIEAITTLVDTRYGAQEQEFRMICHHIQTQHNGLFNQVWSTSMLHQFLRSFNENLLDDAVWNTYKDKLIGFLGLPLSRLV